MVTNIFRILFSYRVIAALCALLSLVSIPLLQGTNTGEEACVYTTEKIENTYVRGDFGYEKYDSQKHAGVKTTYVRRYPDKYILNKPNWSFYGQRCRLERETAIILVIGYFVSFISLFAGLGIARLLLGKLLFFLFNPSHKMQ